MQQALNQAERIRREMEQLSNRGQGQKPGDNGQQQGQRQVKASSQVSNSRAKASNRARVSRPGPRSQGQGQGQQRDKASSRAGQQPGNAVQPARQRQSATAAATASTTRRAAAPTPAAMPAIPIDATNFGGGDPRMGTLPPAAREQAYNDLMRDIGRLRSTPSPTIRTSPASSRI